MPIRSVIVDTSALYALVDADDVHHAEAVRYLRRPRKGVSLVITDTTLMEAITLIKRRLGSEVANRTIQTIRRSNLYNVISLADEDWAGTWRLFEQFRDKEWSPFDCACLAVARARNIREAFAFDIHFDQMAAAGLLRVPERDS